MKSQAWRSARLLLLALAGTSAGSAPSAAQDAAAPLISEVRVDMTGFMGRSGVVPQHLQRCLVTEVTAKLGDRYQPRARGAARLVIRPAALAIGPSSGGPNADIDAPIDSLDGEIIVGQRRIPLLVSVTGDGGGMFDPLGNTLLRTDALCQSFAYWLVRRI